MLSPLLIAILLTSSLASATPYGSSTEKGIAKAEPNSHAQFHRRQEQDDPAPSLTPELQPSPPSAPANVNGGILVCHTAHIAKSIGEFYMNREEAATAVNTFCGRISPGVVFTSVDGTPFQNVQVDGPYNYSMALSAKWSGGDNCPTMDFSNSTNKAVCKQRLLGDIIDECNTSKNGLQFWKGGGNFTKDCITWNIQRVTSLW